jgi:hypothetical protein
MFFLVVVTLSRLDSRYYGLKPRQGGSYFILHISHVHHLCYHIMIGVLVLALNLFGKDGELRGGIGQIVVLSLVSESLSETTALKINNSESNC